AAKSLLRTVQRKTGQPVTMELGCINSAAVERAATYLQQKFEAVGFRVTKTVVEQDELINNALEGNFEAYTWRQFGAINPDLNYVFWSTTTITKPLSINMTRNDDPRIQKQLEIGRSSTTARTRVAAYQKINEYLAQDLPYLWSDRTTWAVVAHPTVQNFNNPTTPSGARAWGFLGGTIWPTQIWLS
ncbi:MAG TPA: hypothetical protein VMB82_02660, partial [Acidimicrobiales bacterium]|nr:hypothetical protein [Acidimicrobiales bacterium]